ncbi:MAG TPA: YceI family protein [Cyclobacteriaceae bacterium]|nr:YceI family protein [Cyclobacteriaceae bacterium]HMV08519.1 YceI family protein [Cyclobacteriaceae bacterium]HMV90007.1 YceI family protein [Cyclobacteriaceae bacterium]HMX01292.1 YceI family protein [Cyclobacteriaceae bacterium]HMX51294.1 YceI family protein [Cyclobacteriaceae bacterium]
MKRILMICFLTSMSSALFSQTLFMTRSGQISFFSKTSVENIDAVNNEVTSILNTGTGEVVFAVLVKSFRFEKALMEEHFNENYMESDKFPKATFQGKITNLASIDFAKDGSYPVTIQGDLTLHNVKQPVNASGQLEVGNGKLILKGNFIVTLADYKIEVPSLVTEKISKTIDIRVNCNYEPKK